MLTGNLMGWKKRMIKEFRFDPQGREWIGESSKGDTP